MTYKGYTCQLVDVDEDTGMIFGRVADIPDSVTFQALTGERLIKEFHESIDVYLEWAAEDSFEPAKPYSTNLQALIPAVLRRDSTLKTAEAGVSLNELVRTEINAVLSSLTPPSKPKKAAKPVEKTSATQKPRITPRKSSKPSA